MLDLTQRRTTSTATLASLGIRRAGSGETALALTLELAIDLADEKAAEVFEQVVPGTLAIYRRRASGSEDRARLNRAPSDLTVVVALAEPKTHDPIVSVIGAIDRLSLVSAPRFVHALFRIRVVVDSSVLGLLADRLDREVSVSVSAPQQVLPFARPETRTTEQVDRDPDAIEVVSFEVGPESTGEQVVYGFGVVVDESADEIVVDDFGAEGTVAASLIVARVALVAPRGVVETYEVRSKALGREPTWADLITALGVDWSTSAEAGEPLRLRDDHVRAALAEEVSSGS